MADIDSELAAFEGMRAELEAQHMGQWVLIYNRDLIGTFSSFESAAQEAVAKFGRGPYLIKQVGASSLTLSTSVMYWPLYAGL